MQELPVDTPPPDVATILRRARGLGESSWRVGIALGLDRVELERLAQDLDRRGIPGPGNGRGHTPPSSSSWS